MNMSINKASSYFHAIRVEPRQLTREERISSNNQKIAVLEEQLTGEKESRVIIKEMITNNEALINNGNRKIDILEQLKASSDRLIGTHKEQRGLMVEARDLAIGARDAAVKVVDATSKVVDATSKVVDATSKVVDATSKVVDATSKVVDAHKESRDLLQESRDLLQESRDLLQGSRDLLQGSRDLLQGSHDLMQKMINIMEKMEAIMMKNPAKYGGLGNSELQKLPEIKEAKSDVIATALVKVEQYPKKEHAALAETAKKVVDATFSEIKPNDTKANSELFYNLGKRIEVAIEDKHKTLMFVDREHEAFNINENNVLQSKNRSYAGLEKFSRINRLAYLDLAIKNIKV